MHDTRPDDALRTECRSCLASLLVELMDRLYERDLLGLQLRHVIFKLAVEVVENKTLPTQVLDLRRSNQMEHTSHADVREA